MSKWRWDQGRLLYFDYNILREISIVLKDLNGVSLRSNPDPLREPLELRTGMPFAPNSYRVWRNYKRVFECSFLATALDNNLVTTDFCDELASNSGKFGDVDDFLFHYIPRFRFPFPAFQDYNSSDPIIYPYCAILKLLMARLLENTNTSLTLDDVFTHLVSNGVTGTEDVDFFRKLRPTSYTPKGDETRQVREMLIFMSQINLLKWNKGQLILDASIEDYYNYNGFADLINPDFQKPKDIRHDDFLSLTSLSNGIKKVKLQTREVPNDEIFVEGKRSRVSHLKIERSPVLRRMFLEQNPVPICDMCTCNTKERYPWTDNLIEIHHVLPLSSSLGITAKGTSLSDVVGLCPSCHRSVHLYYNKWLKSKKEDDFKNRDQAIEVYNEAKVQFVA